MKNFKVWQKLALLGLVLTAPFLYQTWKLMRATTQPQIEQARREMAGIEYLGVLRGFIRELQHHRDVGNAWLHGATTLREAVQRKQADVQAAMSNLDEMDKRFAVQFQTKRFFDPVIAGTEALVLTNTLPPGNLALADELFARRSLHLSETNNALIAQIGEASLLNKDTTSEGYYLMDVLLYRGPELADKLSKARGLGAGLAAAGSAATPEQFDLLDQYVKAVELAMQGLGGQLEQATNYNSDRVRPLLEAFGRVTNSINRESLAATRRATTARVMPMTATEYLDLVTRNLAAVHEFQDSVGNTFRQLLEDRIAAQKMDRVTLLFSALAVLLVALGVGVFIIRDITGPLQQAVTIADRIASGELGVNIPTDQRRDEMGGLLRSFGRMSESLASLVGSVQKSGIQVNTSVTHIAATGKEQQVTANEIAVTTTEIGSTAKAISATSKELLHTMNAVSTVAEAAAQVAGSGQEGLARMGGTMQQIMEAASLISAKLAVLSEKAVNITQVVTTITKVADRTNLLSLNAAIEAEKAGEYGRGFSVVATEIRRLADQTAVATYDIDQMVKEMQAAVSAGVLGMDKFSQEVRRGVTEVQQVGNQLGQIIQQVQALTPRFELVNEGMQSQADGGQQISESLAQLSKAAQQTAQSLQQSNLAIEQLRAAAYGLREGVSRFKLPG